VGSVEYAVRHLKSHVVVVMGHEGCGAVGAAMLPGQDRAANRPTCATCSARSSRPWRVCRRSATARPRCAKR
jgi:carbonic anhydrase